MHRKPERLFDGTKQEACAAGGRVIAPGEAAAEPGHQKHSLEAEIKALLVAHKIDFDGSGELSLSPASQALF
jgi:hypothetical protein